MDKETLKEILSVVKEEFAIMGKDMIKLLQYIAEVVSKDIDRIDISPQNRERVLKIVRIIQKKRKKE